MPDPAVATDTGRASMFGRVTENVMGTVFSFDLRDAVPRRAVAEVRVWLHQVDAIFSTFREDSQIAQLDRGERRLADCHPDVAEVLARCDDARRRTDGCFTSVVGGRLDPSGLVKGWAVERASDMLVSAGSACHAVNGGGDIQTVGSATSDGWVVGIVDPTDRRRLIQTIAVHGGAVATSGSSERGGHVVDPRTGRPAAHFASVTISCPRLTDADVVATAAMVRGEQACGWVDGLDGVEGFFVTVGGGVAQTRGWLGRDPHRC